jgi:hypothetical protein
VLKIVAVHTLHTPLVIFKFQPTLMKPFLTAAGLALGLLTALVPSIASAQYGGFGAGSDNRDPFSRAASGDTTGLMNAINQAQLTGRNNPNYSKEQSGRIDTESADFRTRQLQLLRQRNNQKPTAPVVAPK